MPPSTAERFAGCGDLDAVFDRQDRTVVPWGRAGYTRDERRRLPRLARSTLVGPPQLADIDSTSVYASQTFVVRHHVAYYLTGNWHRTGRTAADQDQVENRYPLIYLDRRNRHVLLGGHHRAMAALIEGRPLRARVLRTDPLEAVAVLPLLLAGARSELVHLRTDDPIHAADLIVQGVTVLVPDPGIAATTLQHLGVDAHEIAERVEPAVGANPLCGVRRG
jgi:hypothetical protein